MNLTVTGWLVVVVGGGAVGRRRAERLAAEEARVIVVDPRPLSPFPEGVTVRAEPFVPAHMNAARLAFACATPEVNARVVAAARAAGVWVCDSSDPEAGDFTLPAVARRGDLTFAVSTGGASPGLAKQIAGQLLDQFDESYGHWSRILSDVRKFVLSRVPDPARRRLLLSGFADPRWLERIRTAGTDVARSEMLAEAEVSV